MSAIIFLTGHSRADALGEITRESMRAFVEFGYDPVEINLNLPEANALLERTLREKQVLFAMAYVGIGRDIMIPGPNGTQHNLWESLGIPFITINGDSPAYFFDRHVNASDNFATIYGFPEHHELRKRLPHQAGLLGLNIPISFDRTPIEAMDFKAKEAGKLIFLKNANDPEQLKNLWRTRCEPTVAQLLLDIAYALEEQMGTVSAPDIDDLVTTLFLEKGIDVEAMTKLRLFFVAQLDDYLRRAKCTFIAEVLSQFPVEIHGDNWEYFDFSGKACTFVKGADYNKSRGLIKNSLGMVDMSPNTSGGWHDRLQRSYGAHTFCLTNEQNCMTQLFGDDCGMTYAFTRESLESKVAEVLAHPKQFVEIGIEASRIFNATFTTEAFVRHYVTIAQTMRLSATKNYIGMQDFFVWPPQSLTKA